MVDLNLLARLAETITIGKSALAELPFGGVNLVLFGDYIQYSPIMDKALYTNFENELTTKAKKVKPLREVDINYRAGHSIMLQINCVVKLTQQMRTMDQRYSELLDRLRLGTCTREDYALLCTRVVAPNNIVKSLNLPPWKDAVILVYVNELRTELNGMAVLDKCYEIAGPPVICVAEDTFKVETVNVPNFRSHVLSLPDNKTELLPGYLPLVPGMPVLLTNNIADELGISTGTSGIFRNLVYEASTENPKSDGKTITFPSGTVFIQKPLYALVEIPKSKLEEKLTLISKRSQVDVKPLLSKPVHKPLRNTRITATRKQLPFVPAYAITTHKSQGQTMAKIIVDLVYLTSKNAETASAYVPLSRAKRLEDLAIYRPFPYKSLLIQPTSDQTNELRRLETLNTQTLDRYQNARM
ncbi:unnamed protein product [Didymodactylos carnosus]|uniref:ATP-dependent DNA helicase n=1 Tax=Didymodactylos carnosus TaxID=1234261 RepID=A0A8S2XLP5_9BILA|nr:unnamed protein product [Didymodactylos carnosus]